MNEQTVQVPVADMQQWVDDLRRFLPPGSYAAIDEMNAFRHKAEEQAFVQHPVEPVLSEEAAYYRDIADTYMRVALQRVSLRAKTFNTQEASKYYGLALRAQEAAS